jgi:thiol-disulfide isomerase/thioredoxin
MKSVMKMMKKVNTQHLLVALLVVVVLFGCRCAMKSMGVETFEAPVGYDGKRVVFALASWCGHCKSLKASGEIDKLKEDPDVPVEINEDDDDANKKYGVKGFPSILIVDGEEKVPHKGPRTAEAIKESFKN